MKKVALYTLVFLSLFASCANSETLPRRIDNFVEKTEASASFMSLKDWEASAADYEILLEEFAENIDMYTPEERQEVYEAIGRYNALLVKQGLAEIQVQTNEFIKHLNTVMDELPNAIKGWLEGFKDGLE